MNSNYILACVSERPIDDNFQLELEKIISSNKFIIFSKEFKSNGYGHSLFLDLDITLTTNEILNMDLMKLASLHRVDVGLIPKNVFESKKKLAIFDMDSTLITSEVIDEMAIRHGIGDKVKLITSRAMNGELNFDESLRERVSLLKGFHKRHMEDILQGLSFTPGTKEFLKILKRSGIKTAIASGGFKFFAKNIQMQLEMDYVFANDLEFEGDLLTGNVLGPIVNAQMKESIVIDLAKKENLSLEQVVAIGDGANDIPMLLKAGLGIAIHAKEKVQKNANYRINFGPMTHALSYMNHEII